VYLLLKLAIFCLLAMYRCFHGLAFGLLFVLWKYILYKAIPKIGTLDGATGMNFHRLIDLLMPAFKVCLFLRIMCLQ
jgi:hypothetical protein